MRLQFFGLLLFLVFRAIGAQTTVADEWPQWRGPNRDGVWREDGLVERFASDELEIRWRQPIGSGYSGPTVAGGRVYVTDRLVEPEQIERVHCFDAKSGEPVWSYRYDCPYKVSYTAGPRASVTIDDGRAYSLGTMGHLFCFDAAGGKPLWSKDLKTQYKIRMPIWGIAASPLVEGKLVIVQIGGLEACLVAFDKKTGREAWRALADHASYSVPIMIEQAGRRVMVCWTGESFVGLNAATGEIYWRQPLKPAKMVINIATPVVKNNRAFFTSFYDGSFMLSLGSDEPSAELLWSRSGRDERHTDALHSIISTPYLEGDYVYGIDSYGEFRCLDAETGKKYWTHNCLASVWGSPLIADGKVYVANEDGNMLIFKLAKRKKLLAEHTFHHAI